MKCHVGLIQASMTGQISNLCVKPEPLEAPDRVNQDLEFSRVSTPGLLVRLHSTLS